MGSQGGGLGKIDEAVLDCRGLREEAHDLVAVVIAEGNAILAPFGIGFAPYVTNSFMTEFINPDKYYLYLQSGMEVISTDIPQARRMDDRIHIARSAGEIVEMVTRIESDPTYRKNKDVTQNPSWDQRAEELIEIVQSHIISHRIGSKRSTQL